MIKQLKAAGYSVIRTEKLSTLYTEFCVDPFEVNRRKDDSEYLAYHARRSASQMGQMLADELFETLQFKHHRKDEIPIDVYRTEITIVKP